MNETAANDMQNSMKEDLMRMRALAEFSIAEKIRCENEVLIYPRPDDDNIYCNATFDDWGCWNYTMAGTVAIIPCPPMFYSNEFASRECELDGNWILNSLTNRTFSNYTQCTLVPLPFNDLTSTLPVYIFVVGYSISILMLLVSLLIYFGFRQLRCERITVHKNLFISYVLTGITWILYYLLVHLDGHVLFFNPLWCRVLHVMAHYCTVSNFAWMFCEGIYLNVIMMQTFRTGKTLLRVLLFVGWGNPLIFVTAYVCARALFSENIRVCWYEPDNLQWIMFGPVIVSVVINTLNLINLVRLLVTKLRQVPEASQSKKAVRATLILVPLFGLQYLLFPFQPKENTTLHDVYLCCIALLISLQGSLVSIMFCFCNGEVTSLLRRKWHQYRLMTKTGRRNTAITSSTCTEGYSVVNTSLRDIPCSQKSKIAPDAHHKTSDSVEMKPLKMDQDS